ncbi:MULTISPECIES: phosphate ABC transporter permease subunit PstC [Vibrio]|uniref:Phosphate transport system permease protein n=2 Tax=Vibrio TaxID=662 RepID=A0A7X4LMT0_9VIBR|nr:phosphate ABC transporter permease subunit PstC [Vibrio nitrifigilis]MBF9000933.1 phosphate ABC transporter permease subunit PstC [Vibrio nitrifigilis]MZI94878.1 phosphate ABC transporter permease subunit PstC [Vibrio eleionomae]
MIASHAIYDRCFKQGSFSSALLITVMMAAIFATLVGGAMPAIREFGLSFVFSTSWDPINFVFGAGNALYGTLVSSIIAVIIATPIGIAIAITLSELLPKWVSYPVGLAIELLSAVPSIIYGMWGLFVFAPWFAEGPQLWMLEHLSTIPVVGTLFSGAPLGQGLLTAGIILAFMILPILTSLIKDALSTIPNVLRESSYGIGANTFEVISKILLPSIKSSIFGAFILALGRALGETMAVTFVIGNSQDISSSLFMPATSISATIANQFNEADGIKMSSLMALGLVLFVVTFLVMGYARLQFRKNKAA